MQATKRCNSEASHTVILLFHMGAEARPDDVPTAEEWLADLVVMIVVSDAEHFGKCFVINCFEGLAMPDFESELLESQ